VDAPPPRRAARVGVAEGVRAMATRSRKGRRAARGAAREPEPFVPRYPPGSRRVEDVPEPRAWSQQECDDANAVRPPERRIVEY
jgi:hypothetical protein